MQKENVKKEAKSELKGWLIFLAIVAVIIALMMNSGKYSAPGLYGHLAIPGRFLIANLSKFIGGYGVAILLLTAIVRLCLMPLMIKQAQRATVNGIANKAFQPILKKIKTNMMNANKKGNHQDYKEYESQMVHVYKKHHLGLGSMGCGTMLLQVPIFAMLYAAIRYSPEVKSASFIGIPLGQSSKIVALFCFILYAINSFISWHANKKRNAGKHQSQKAKMFGTGIFVFMPIWIGSLCLSVDAGLALYFCVGGLFVIGQQIYIQSQYGKFVAEGKVMKKKLVAEQK